jgi:peptidoglycan/LPS O-acetylase OafA/YrhL
VPDDGALRFANGIIGWLLLSGAGSLCAWKTLRRRGLVGLAALNAIACFIAYNALLPSRMNIRVDLLLTIPLVLAIVVLAIRHRRPPPTDQDGADHRGGR